MSDMGSVEARMGLRSALSESSSVLCQLLGAGLARVKQERQSGEIQAKLLRRSVASSEKECG